MTRYEHIVLYDGVCGLCDRFVSWLCDHDPERRFAYASLQSDWAKNVLAQHDMGDHDLTSMVVIVRHNAPNEQVFVESTAVLFVLGQLGGFYRLANLGWIFPRFLRDAVYRFVAKNRYRWFGKSDTCRLPDPSLRDRFLEF